MNRKSIVLLVMVSLISAGCATQAGNTDSTSLGANDPYESFNRKMFAFNQTSDKYFFRPIGRAYKKVIPGFMRKGIGNFFDNLTTPRSALNNFLQGKPERGFSELGRFVFNSTFGIGGLFDVAQASGVERYDEDFGQTLAVWGLPEGNYLVVPIFGPRTYLSTAAVPGDVFTGLRAQIDDAGTRDRLYAVGLLSTRARLLATEEFLNKSTDPYIAFREAYLQNREFNIYDGDPPLQDDFYDFDDFEDFDDEDVDDYDDGEADE